jgi:hypothetical protein
MDSFTHNDKETNTPSSDSKDEEYVSKFMILNDYIKKDDKNDNEASSSDSSPTFETSSEQPEHQTEFTSFADSEYDVNSEQPENVQPDPINEPDPALQINQPNLFYPALQPDVFQLDSNMEDQVSDQVSQLFQ